MDYKPFTCTLMLNYTTLILLSLFINNLFN
nr:MAG TPA: hypothetical protein [Caudoviricetes sp.]